MIAAIECSANYKDIVATVIIALGVIIWLRYEAKHAPLVDEDENIIDEP